MSNEFSRQIVTEEQRQQLHAARRNGGFCAACGRDLTQQETVWYERFTMPGMGATMYLAPVGAECVSPIFLSGTQGQEPERCAGCGRGVHYPPDTPQPGTTRNRVLCSRRCGAHVTVAKRAAKRGDG